MVIKYTPQELYDIGRSIFIETKNCEDWIFHHGNYQEMCPSITSTSRDDDNKPYLHSKLPTTSSKQAAPKHRQSYAQFCIDVLAPYVDESFFDRGLKQHWQQQPKPQPYQKPPSAGKSIQLKISDLIPSAKSNVSSGSSSISTPPLIGPTTNACNSVFHEPTFEELQQQIGPTTNTCNSVFKEPTLEELQQQHQLSNPVAEFFRKAQLNFHAQTSIDPTKVRRLSEVEAELVGSQREMSY